MIPVTSWSRRYRTREIDRTCARPGCGEPAEATLRFQPTRREAWIVDVDDDTPRTRGDLCNRHAVTLELPRGWQLNDQRSVLAEVTVVVVREPVVEVDPEPEVVGDEPHEPVALAAETDDDAPGKLGRLAGALDASTPLLKRAFDNVVMPFDADN